MSFDVYRRGTITLARPRVRVITSTKWAVNMTRKYRTVSSAMVLKSPRTLNPDVLDLFAKKTIKDNATESDVYKGKRNLD